MKTNASGLLSALFVILILSSCGEKHTSGPVVLDNGNKWTANAETTQGINQMIMLMDNFEAKEDSKAYTTLAEKLSGEFDLIFKNCTMQGEAHVQLHNYLLPMKDMFATLKSKELDQQKAGFDSLKSYLLTYPDYFQ